MYQSSLLPCVVDFSASTINKFSADGRRSSACPSKLSRGGDNAASLLNRSYSRIRALHRRRNAPPRMKSSITPARNTIGTSIATTRRPKPFAALPAEIMADSVRKPITGKTMAAAVERPMRHCWATPASGSNAHRVPATTKLMGQLVAIRCGACASGRADLVIRTPKALKRRITGGCWLSGIVARF
jgi:hypothetical protein